MLSNWSRGEVSSCEAGLYLPSDLRLRRAMIKKTRTPTMAMKSIPPTTGPTIKAISPVLGLCSFHKKFVLYFDFYELSLAFFLI